MQIPTRFYMQEHFLDIFNYSDQVKEKPGKTRSQNYTYETDFMYIYLKYIKRIAYWRKH